MMIDDPLDLRRLFERQVCLAAPGNTSRHA